MAWNMDRDLDSCSASDLVIRENFKKDYKLSCPLLDDFDAFSKSLDIWDLRDEWCDYLDMAQKYDDFDAYRKNVRNEIVKTVEAVKGFSALQPVENPYPEYKGPRTYLKPENCGKRLVSIDLIRGNYQSLRFLNPEFVLGTKTYEEFVGKFTKEPCLINSKYFRQLVFGLLKPDVQASVQKKILSHIISEIMKVKNIDIIHLTSDEVVFPINSDADLLKIREATRNLPYDFRVEEFTIHHIPNKYKEPWYVRYNRGESKARRLMSIHVKYLFQVYNFAMNIENGKKDFWWRERGRLCALLEPETFAPIGQPDPSSEENPPTEE